MSLILIVCDETKKTDSTVRLYVGEWTAVKLCKFVCVCVSRLNPPHVPDDNKVPSHSALGAQPPISAAPNKQDGEMSYI